MQAKQRLYQRRTPSVSGELRDAEMPAAPLPNHTSLNPPRVFRDTRARRERSLSPSKGFSRKPLERNSPTNSSSNAAGEKIRSSDSGISYLSDDVSLSYTDLDATYRSLSGARTLAEPLSFNNEKEKGSRDQPKFTRRRRPWQREEEEDEDEEDEEISKGTLEGDIPPFVIAIHEGVSAWTNTAWHLIRPLLSRKLWWVIPAAFFTLFSLILLIYFGIGIFSSLVSAVVATLRANNRNLRDLAEVGQASGDPHWHELTNQIIDKFDQQEQQLKDTNARIEELMSVEAAEKRIVSLIDDSLPSRLAVGIDPKTGKLEISNQFWLFASQLVDDRVHDILSSDWERFLNANQKVLKQTLESEEFMDELRKESMKDITDEAIESSVNEKVDEHLRKHGAVSRSEFTKTLAEQLQRLRDEIVDSMRSPEESEAIEKMLEKMKDLGRPYDQSLPDFADIRGGATVDSSHTTSRYVPFRHEGWRFRAARWFSSYRGSFPIAPINPPETALSKDMDLGDCWPFDGHHGVLAVTLSRSMLPRSFSVSHLPLTVSVRPESAPKDVALWASTALWPQAVQESLMASDDSPRPEELGSDYVLVGTGQYDLMGSSTQEFAIEERFQNLPVEKVALEISSNWGCEDFTCLYRFRAFGTPADQSFMKDSEKSSFGASSKSPRKVARNSRGAADNEIGLGDDEVVESVQ